MKLLFVIACAFSVMYLLAVAFLEMRQTPIAYSVAGRLSAGLFIVVTLAWWVAEIFKGGGDPNR